MVLMSFVGYILLGYIAVTVTIILAKIERR